MSGKQGGEKGPRSISPLLATKGGTRSCNVNSQEFFSILSLGCSRLLVHGLPKKRGQAPLVSQLRRDTLFPCNRRNPTLLFSVRPYFTTVKWRP